jgi:hypothetical protein
MSFGSTTSSERAEQLPFQILDEAVKGFSKFNTTGRNLLIKFNSPSEWQNRNAYLRECVANLTHYLVDKMPDNNLVGFRIRNNENLMDKAVGISYRGRD